MPTLWNVRLERLSTDSVIYIRNTEPTDLPMLAVTMLTMLILSYWGQLLQSMGPLVVMMRKQLLQDIRVFIIAYIIFYFAFTLGLGLLLHEESWRKPWEANSGTYNAFRWFLAQDNSSYSLDGVMKTSFWIMFSAGQPGLIGTVNKTER